jgi:hypothetical protein
VDIRNEVKEGGGKMNISKQQSTISKIIGVLVESDSSASDAIKITEQAKETYLDRCRHITSNKKAD